MRLKDSSRRDLSKTALFDIVTLLVVEQSSLKSQSRGCAKTPILTATSWIFYVSLLRKTQSIYHGSNV